MFSNVVIISNDLNIVVHTRTTALTLTKLNKQIHLKEITVDKLTVPSNDISSNTNYIIVDMDEKFDIMIDYINEIRNDNNLCSIKIIALISSDSCQKREGIFSAGCDSIMTKKEFFVVAENILLF
jgi:CheY-like chemotaxis protein